MRTVSFREGRYPIVECDSLTTNLEKRSRNMTINVHLNRRKACRFWELCKCTYYLSNPPHVNICMILLDTKMGPNKFLCISAYNLQICILDIHKKINIFHDLDPNFNPNTCCFKTCQKSLCVSAQTDQPPSNNLKTLQYMYIKI